MNKQSYFHVTLLDNLVSIMRNGIDPSYCPRERQRAWFVERSLVGWAILHTVSKLKVPTAELCVLEVYQPPYLFQHTRYSGVFCTQYVLRICSAYPIDRFQNGDQENVRK